MNENLKYKKGIAFFSYRLTTLILFTILVAGSIAVQAFAQEFVDAVTVTTDKEVYEEGDTMTISGSVRERLSGYDVTLRVFSVTGNLVTVYQLPVSDYNTFGINLVTGGPLWRSVGPYTIKVFYGTETRTAETVFQYEGLEDVDCFMPCLPKFQVEGEDVSIHYLISGGKIINIKVDKPAKSLIVEIKTTNDGKVSLILPRSIIDARTGSDGKSGEYDVFFILVDGTETDFEETIDSESRALSIPFQNGTSQIEIIGTWVIPEFGTIATITLAVAIVSIVVISTSRSSVLWMKKEIEKYGFSNS